MLYQLIEDGNIKTLKNNEIEARIYDKYFDLIIYLNPDINRLLSNKNLYFFNKLEKNNLKSIIENQLAILKNRLTSKNIKILFDLEVVNLLSEKGYSREYGARPIKRLIEKEIGDIIADALINNQIKEDSYFTVGVKEGKFKLKITS